MKILQIIPSINIGGGEKFAIELSNTLAGEFGDEVVLVVIHASRPAANLSYLVGDNIRVIFLGNGRLGALSKILSLFRVIREEAPDVINTHMRASTFNFIPSLFFTKGVFHTVHSIAQKENGLLGRWLNRVRSIYPGFNFIAISEAVYSSVVREYKWGRAHLIPNGVLLQGPTQKMESVSAKFDSIRSSGSGVIFLCVGRLSPVKNQEMIVRIFNRLYQEGDRSALVLIGGVNDRDIWYRDYVQRLADGNIFFLGPVNNVVDYLICSDYLIIGSVYEGLPLVALEAMSLGVPIVSTPAGGMVDIIETDVNGVLADSFELDGLERVVRDLLSKNSPFDREGIKELFFRNYDMKLTADSYRRLYCSMQRRCYRKGL